MIHQKISDLKTWLLEPKNKFLTFAMIGMLMIILFTSLLPKPEAISKPENSDSADTFIPAGYVLVPIEIQNIQSLSSLIGQFALVDLFSGAPGEKQKKVGEKLKLLRAPLNPEQFAVLVPESEVSHLLQQPGPYWAVIQNPSRASKEHIQREKTQTSKVEYYAGE
jgi:hypothetical protein